MKQEHSGDEADADTDVSRTLTTLFNVGLVVVAAAIVALFASQRVGLIAALGIGTIIILASAAVGAGLGFLFALPRVLTKDPKDEPTQDSTIQKQRKQRLLGSNTNLERVSDWLTTMIVGVGLTQLGNIDAALFRFRLFLSHTATVFPNAAGNTAGALPNVGPMLLIFGLIAGFISLYLFTRLRLSALFQRVEEDLSGKLEGAPADAVRAAASSASSVSGAEENPTIQALLVSGQPSIDESLNLMYTLLYRPRGYQQVIDLGGKLSNTVITKRPEYWFYLAAAFGQKHRSLSEGGTSDESRSAKDNAFDCARRAIDLDTSFKSRLWHLTDPDGIDNDLADFRNDAEFRAMVGMRST
jgi:hypothetical protein